MNSRKLKKLITKPGLFFRDLLIKRYPLIYNEIAIDALSEPGVIAHDQLFENVLPDSRSVDVVFTWVDGSDSAWIEKRCRFMGAHGEQSDESPHAHSAARFQSHGELTYAVRSVLQYMPWVAHIYIVTDNQKPRLADADSRISLVDHHEIVPETMLPTFNSHVIEANLHRIPHLSECFIYFNDDVFAARNLAKAHFFSPNGLASLFASKKSIAQMAEGGLKTATLSASVNSANLLAGIYDVRIDVPLVHTYVPLRKSMYELAWHHFFNEIMAFLPNRFRAANDLNLATFLVPWLTYLEGNACFRRDICRYFNIRSPAAGTQYKSLLLAKAFGASPHSFCTNDFSDTNAIPEYEVRFLQFVEQYYGWGSTGS